MIQSLVTANVVRTDVSEERITSIIRVTRIGGDTFLGNISSFLQEPYGITSQKMAFFIVCCENLKSYILPFLCVHSFGIVLYILCNLISSSVRGLSSGLVFILIFYAQKGVLYIKQYQNCVSLSMSFSEYQRSV
jgi:hypothetical protein